MDYCFENRCEVNESMIAEYFKTQQKKNRILFGLVMVTGVLLVIRFFMGLLVKHTVTSFGLVTMVVIVFAIYFIYCFPSVETKKAIGCFREFAGGQSAVITYQFADTIRVACGEKMMEFEYKQIMGFDFWEVHLVLTVPRKAMLFIAKDSFTKGTFEELKQFLREKRPDAKILK